MRRGLGGALVMRMFCSKTRHFYECEHNPQSERIEFRSGAFL